MTKKIANLIEKFLAEKKEVVDNGWPEVTTSELEDLHIIISSLIEAKYQPDADGDYPISSRLTNVTRERFPYVSPIPHYSTSELSPDQISELFKIMSSNVLSTTRELECFARQIDEKKVNK